MEGYSKLADFMTKENHPILKKYQNLATRDLLFLQAELCDLDFRYREVVEKSITGGDERRYYDRDWLLMQSSEDRGFKGEQWAIAIAIRAKLREYYNTLSQYSEIASIRQPTSSERSILQDWIKSPSLGGGCGFLGRDLGGFEQCSVYDTIHQSDLAILSDGHGEDDLFTRFIIGPAFKCYHWARKHSKASSHVKSIESLPIDPENRPVGENRAGLYHYDDRQVQIVTNLLGTVFCSLLPLISIIVLSFIVNPRVRLGLVCAFAALFSCCLAIATKARRVEIFAATAAFASVQVVFIGNTNLSM